MDKNKNFNNEIRYEPNMNLIKLEIKQCEWNQTIVSNKKTALRLFIIK